MAWDRVCIPKKDGGLGVKNVEAFNLALLSKWIWRCLNDFDASWRPLLSHHYGDLQKSFTKDPVCKGDRKYSLWWRDLISLEDSFLYGRNGFVCTIRSVSGNRADIYFWLYSWLCNELLKDIFPFSSIKLNIKMGLS